MLFNSIANINVALKKNSLIVFEKHNIQLISLLDLLWKKKLIIGYSIFNKRIKIVLKYTKGVSLIKSLKIGSTPSNKLYKKAKEKNFLYVLTNSKLGICIVDNLNRDTSYGKIIFRIII
jgi:hypothetical protein